MIDKNSLDAFLRLSDEEMRQKLEKAAIAAGADGNRVKVLLGDTGKLRRVISSLTPEDAERMINMFGRGNAQKIADALTKKD